MKEKTFEGHKNEARIFGYAFAQASMLFLVIYTVLVAFIWLLSRDWTAALVVSMVPGIFLLMIAGGALMLGVLEIATLGLWLTVKQFIAGAHEAATHPCQTLTFG